MPDFDKITREVESERAALAHTLDALTDTVQPQKIAQDASNAAQEIGADVLKKAWGSLRENPAGGLLVTLGLGLLASGPSRQPRPAGDSTTANSPEDAMIGFDERVAAAHAEMNKPSADEMRAGLSKGLDRLPASAQKRVLQARKAALTAQEQVEAKVKRTARKATGFVQQQPLTAGALALGFGLVAGSLLRGTRREDAVLGHRRDALMAQARESLETEMSRVADRAETALRNKAG